MLGDLVVPEVTEAEDKSGFETVTINHEVVEKIRTFIAEDLAAVPAMEVFIALKLLIAIAEEQIGITNVEFS